ncbi:hypothetical protein GCM10011578_097720 [Streptomyces fuscichromogenes]|uniref:Uncharacterized protein n=1 Tax=Streptomyces fuscichromogenes TaxID=1324013 RepID=A0A917XPL2_9ACTN|nr:hypothetical protein GCM10011578_097720 [Streptomyces fuscichromogenes]
MRWPRILTLVVAPPEEFELPLRQVADHVPGAVEAGVRPVVEGGGEEGRRRAVRAGQVAEADANPADVELSGYADGYGLPVLVQDVDLVVAQRPADRDAGSAERGVPGDHGLDGVVGALGRPVGVGERHLGEPGEPAAAQIGRQGLVRVARNLGPGVTLSAWRRHQPAPTTRPYEQSDRRRTHPGDLTVDVARLKIT